MTDPNLPPPPSQPSMPGSGQGSDKLLSILCHISPFLSVPFLLPLIVYLVKREDSKLVAAHASEAFNFHLSLAIYAVPCWFLIFILIGIPLLLALGLMLFICAIVAAIKASEGGFYRYPLTIRLLS